MPTHRILERAVVRLRLHHATWALDVACHSNDSGSMRGLDTRVPNLASSEAPSVDTSRCASVTGCGPAKTSTRSVSPRKASCRVNPCCSQIERRSLAEQQLEFGPLAGTDLGDDRCLMFFHGDPPWCRQSARCGHRPHRGDTGSRMRIVRRWAALDSQAWMNPRSQGRERCRRCSRRASPWRAGSSWMRCCDAWSRPARALTGARYSALGVLDETGNELAQFITSGIDDEQRRLIGELPRGRGILGVLIQDATPLRLADLGDDPRSVGFPPNHPPMRSLPGGARDGRRRGVREPVSDRAGRG